MGINITQFSPPGTVSKLVWDDDMEPGAGKIFKGDLTGNVTGDVTGDVVGNITNGGVNGYLLRSGVVSASSGTLIVPAGSSVGNTPVTITLNGNGTYCIVDNTQKCYYPSPCTIPVTLSPGGTFTSYNNDAYARSYDADGVLIDSVGNGGNLNIYGASYIILNGGTSKDNDDTTYNDTMSVADAYIDADTSVIPGMIAPPTTGVFTGDVVGNVTGDLTGNLTGNVAGKTSYTWVVAPALSGLNTGFQISARNTTQVLQLSPGDTLSGTIDIIGIEGTLQLQFIDKSWSSLGPYTIVPVGNTTFTIPAYTNGIYLKNNGDTIGRCNIKHFKIT